MRLDEGDQVLVNVAPFIASHHELADAVPCTVLEVSGQRVKVRTCDPYREIELWIDDRWIEVVLPEQAP